MNTNIIVIDDFLDDPDTLRKAALMMEYKESPNYKGMRAVSNLYQWEVDQKLQQILNSQLEYVGSSWKTHYTIAGTPTVAHADPCPPLGQYGGVLYLFPNAPLEAGTALYRHKETHRRYGDPSNFESAPAPFTYIDMTRYEVVDYVANIYNRLILFNGDLLHSMQNPFGWDLATGRMTQLFFINKVKLHQDPVGMP